MATHEVTLDVDKSSALAAEIITARVGDTGTVIKATVLKDGAALTGATARFQAVKPDHTYADQSASVSGNTVTVTLDPKFLSAPGIIKTAYFRLTASGKVETTPDIWINVLPNAEAASGGATGPYVSEVEQLISQLNSVKSQMQTATNSANSAARNANDAASDAQDAADDARDAAASATSAASSARSATTTAQGAANNANNAATYARSVADNLQSSVIGDEDVAEMRGQIDKLGSMIANATGKFFYMDGTIYAPSSKASVSGSTIKLADTCSVSGTTINLA